MASRIPKILGTASLFATFVISATAQTQSVKNKTVAAGGVLKLGQFAEVSRDCSSNGLPVVRLSSGPAHGVVRTSKASVFVTFESGYEQCNSRRVSGISVEYKPAKGFIGPDNVVLDVIYPDGREGSYAYNITVK